MEAHFFRNKGTIQCSFSIWCTE